MSTDRQKQIRLAIIGGGAGGLALLRLFHREKGIKIIGVADTRADAVAVKDAQSINIPTTTDFRDLIKQEGIDLIVDVTGNPDVGVQIQKEKRPRVELLGGTSAKLMWNFIEMLERKVEERTRDLKEAQKKLVESARLADLGTLAAGVGHELRNPLTVIKNATYYLRSRIKEADPKVQRHLALLDREVAVSEHIIADLLSFSRVSKPNLRDTDIRTVVTEALSAVEIPEEVRVKTEIGMDLGFFPSDPGYLRQVLTNLISNAVQAMPTGGELKIRTEAQDGKVLITVADTGTGITPENRSKIFEPFFTTKAKGIGLGLAVAKRLVDQLDGRISVNSEPGKGTIFVIELRTPAEVV